MSEEYIKPEDAVNLACPNGFLVEALEALPTADVAPVVHCKDCFHKDDFGCTEPFTWCDYWNIGITDKNKHFCAEGVETDGKTD